MSMSSSDIRFSLTEEESIEVRALRDRCDKEGIEYRSIFELAKYCLVSTSISNTQNRREDSFQRIKSKRKFEKENCLNDVDLFDAIDDLEKNIPEWAIPCGKVNEKWCVGYTSGSAKPNYLIKNSRTVFKVELARFDLAAADLEEARRGFYIVGTSKDLNASPLKSIRAAIKLKPLMGKMNANRVKGVYYEAPKTIVLLSNMFLSVIPKRIKERINLVRNLKTSKLWTDYPEEMQENLHTKLGGDYKVNLVDWFKQRLEVREESDQKVKL